MLQQLQGFAADLAAHSAEAQHRVITREECDALRADAASVGAWLTWVSRGDGNVRWMLSIGSSIVALPGVDALRKFLEMARRVIRRRGPVDLGDHPATARQA